MRIFKLSKAFVAVFVALLCSMTIEAQVFIDGNLFRQTTNVRLKLKVIEAANKEAMGDPVLIKQDFDSRTHQENQEQRYRPLHSQRYYLHFR